VTFNEDITFNQDIIINASTMMNGNLLLENLNVTNSAIFGGICPASTVGPTTNNHLCRLRFLNDNFVKLNATQTILGNTTISGSTIFTTLPTSSIVPSTVDDLTNKLYVDTSIAGCAKLSTANTFTDVNTFSNRVNLNFATSVNSVITFNGLSTVFNGQTEFKNYCPLANTNPTLDDHLVNLFFFQSYVAGVYLYKAISGANNYVMIPIFKSTPNLSNYTSQPLTSGALTTPQSGTVVGNYSSININDVDTSYLVMPNYGLIVNLNSNYSNQQLLNYKNTTSDPVVVAPVSANFGTSIRIYFNDIIIN